jgi:hypothetical protein
MIVLETPVTQLDKNGQSRAVQGLSDMQETSKEGLFGRARSGSPDWQFNFSN